LNAALQNACCSKRLWLLRPGLLAVQNSCKLLFAGLLLLLQAGLLLLLRLQSKAGYGRP
jgi:hypothetical protein